MVEQRKEGKKGNTREASRETNLHGQKEKVVKKTNKKKSQKKKEKNNHNKKNGIEPGHNKRTA